MDTEFDLESFKKGRIYQLSKNDCERLANRILQYYDKDASKDLSAREIKGMVRELYKSIGINKATISNEEAASYLRVLVHRDATKLDEADFVKAVGEYFDNDSKTGSLDLQNQFAEIIDFADAQNKIAVSLPDVMRELLKIARGRWGDAFVQSQEKICENLFKKHKLSLQDDLPYDALLPVFQEIIRNSGSVEKNEVVPIEDITRLLGLIDTKGSRKISFFEFRVFYFRGLIGS